MNLPEIVHAYKEGLLDTEAATKAVADLIDREARLVEAQIREMEARASA